MEFVATTINSILIYFAGIFMPVLTFLLPRYGKAIKEISQRYDTEAVVAETRLNEALQPGGKVDSDKLSGLLSELKAKKRFARVRKWIAKPWVSLGLVWIPAILGLFFTGYVKAFSTGEYREGCFYLGVFCFVLCLLGSVQVIFLMIDMVNLEEESKQKDTEASNQILVNGLQRIVSVLEKNSAESLFIKKIYLQINKVKITDEKVEVIRLERNKKTKLEIVIVNSDKKMAKVVEAGLTLPISEFSLTENKGYTISAADQVQVVRYSKDMIHGNTSDYFVDLEITALKEGTYPVRTFVKGENVPAIYRMISIVVVDK